MTKLFIRAIYLNNISLTPKLEQFIRIRIGSRRYLPASEGVREALRLLEQKDKRLEELHVEIQKGLNSNRREPLNIEATKAKARKRLRRES